LDVVPILFDRKAQTRYEEIRDRFKMLYDELKLSTTEDDQQPGGLYARTEKLLDTLHELNRDYVGIAAPRFLAMLKDQVLP
jgi:hypothetical protein